MEKQQLTINQVITEIAQFQETYPLLLTVELIKWEKKFADVKINKSKDQWGLEFINFLGVKREYQLQTSDKIAVFWDSRCLKSYLFEDGLFRSYREVGKPALYA